MANALVTNALTTTLTSNLAGPLAPKARTQTKIRRTRTKRPAEARAKSEVALALGIRFQGGQAARAETALGVAIETLKVHLVMDRRAALLHRSHPAFVERDAGHIAHADTSTPPPHPAPMRASQLLSICLQSALAASPSTR